MRKMSKKLLVRYKNKTFDVANFVEKHPGGPQPLLTAMNTDIDVKFDSIVPHSAAAKYLMKDYLVSGLVNGGEINDACKIEYDHIDHIMKTDESMEHLVDWSRGMVSQIGNLKSNYMEWVNKPVDRPLRLFDSDILEMCSKTPFWVILCYWIPIIILMIKISFSNSERYSISYVLVHLGFGVFFWTLLEYSIHRWIFHLNFATQNRFVCTFHFIFHGQHHKVPFDPYRLVFPLIPATIIMSILGYLVYKSLYPFTNHPLLVVAGTTIGYVIYDMIHYYTHFGNPSFGHLHFMKRYHYQHHFAHSDIGYGISSSIWDRIFNTQIILRKLKYYSK